MGVARSQQKDLNARIIAETDVRKRNYLPDNLLVSAGASEEVADLCFPSLLIGTGETCEKQSDRQKWRERRSLRVIGDATTHVGEKGLKQSECLVRDSKEIREGDKEGFFSSR